MKRRICTILCLITMIGFALVYVQEKWHPFKLKPLAGVTFETERPELTYQNFASGNYQTNIEQYSREKFGFREWHIRLYNQFIYSVFNTTHAQSAIHVQRTIHAP